MPSDCQVDAKWLFCHHQPTGPRNTLPPQAPRGTEGQVERPPDYCFPHPAAHSTCIGSPRPSQQGLRSDRGHLPKIHRCPQSHLSLPHSVHASGSNGTSCTQISLVFPDTGSSESDNSPLTHSSRSHVLQIPGARLDSKCLDLRNEVFHGDKVHQRNGRELLGTKHV